MQSKNNQAALNEAKHHDQVTIGCIFWIWFVERMVRIWGPISLQKKKQNKLDYFEHFYTVTLADICTQPNMMKHDKTTPNKIYKWKYIFSH